MKKKIPLENKDIKDWEEYINNPHNVFDKDIINKKIKNIKKYKKFKFDLHGFTLSEANAKVKEIINLCIKEEYSEILFITGKGIHSNNEQNVYQSDKLSKLRYSIPNYIHSDADLSKIVKDIKPANREEGGEGALTVKLKL